VEQQTQYVGIDLHRRRSVIVRRNQAGETDVYKRQTWSLDVEHVVETHSLTVFYNPMIAVPAMYGATPMVRTGAKGAGSEGSLVPRPN